MRNSAAALFPVLLPLVQAQSPGSNCFDAKQSTVCGAFSGHFIDLDFVRGHAASFWQWPEFLSVSSPLDLDQAINSIDTQERSFLTGFGCPDWDGTGWRYRLTAICGYLISFSTNCTLNPNPQQGVICRDAWQDFASSGQQMFSNTSASICPHGAISTVNRRKISGLLTFVYESSAFFQKSFAGLQASGGDCAVALEDANTCGFGNTPKGLAEAQQFCSNASPEACCRQMTLASSGTSPAAPNMPASATPSGPNVPAASSAANQTPTSSSSSSSNLGLIAGAAGGGALVLLLGIGFGTHFVRRSNKKKDQMLLEHHQKLQHGNTGFYSPTGSGSPYGGVAYPPSVYKPSTPPAPLSDYHVAPSVVASSAYGGSDRSAQRYPVVVPFQPMQHDEIDLHIGDVVVIG
ncbi:hypothetical protein BDK51DRAFT_32876, partial [Blyttiomyces helicus]